MVCHSNCLSFNSKLSVIIYYLIIHCQSPLICLSLSLPVISNHLSSLSTNYNESPCLPFPSICHSSLWYSPCSVILHCLSFSIVYYSPLSVIPTVCHSNFLTFPIVCHFHCLSFPLSVILHCLSLPFCDSPLSLILIVCHSQLSVISIVWYSPLSIIGIVCHSPLSVISIVCYSPLSVIRWGPQSFFTDKILNYITVAVLLLIIGSGKLQTIGNDRPCGIANNGEWHTRAAMTDNGGMKDNWELETVEHYGQLEIQVKWWWQTIECSDNG